MGVTREGEICRLTVTGYAADGEGVARMEDGMVAFVRGGIRGEVCEAKIDKVGRSAVWAHVVRPVDPSPARQEPDCPYYALCGGCAMRHMSYAEELEAKRSRVEEALTRLGASQVRVEVIHAAEETVRYRNKAQYPVQEGKKGAKIGFYRRRSHSVVDVEDCLLQSQSASRLRGAAREWMERWKIPAYDERTGKGLVRHVYVRTNRAGESLFCLVVNGKRVPHEAELAEALRGAEPGLVGVMLGINEERTNVILGSSYRTLWGREYLEDVLCGLTFRLGPASFYQVNTAQTEVLYRLALDFAALTGKERVLDLYCGIGTIGLCAAHAAGRVTGAEIVPQAVEDAKANALRNGIGNAEFFCADAGEMAQKLQTEGARPDVIFVDPPRKGLNVAVIEAVAAMGPSRLVYVSCDPGTLGRDVGRFKELGYVVQKAQAVDLFPRTHHVETVCLLSRLNTLISIAQIETDSAQATGSF